MQLSSRLLNMQESSIRKLVPLAQNAIKEGKKVYHLNIGQPDIETPIEYFEGIKNFEDKVLSYAHSAGDTRLIKAMVGYYKKFDIDFNTEDILITNGGSEALTFAMVASCEYGDEVLVPEPYYANYNGFSAPIGVKIMPIRTYAEDGFKLPPLEEMEKLITPKTKAILVSNPGNPTGRVLDEEEVESIKQFALRNNLFVIADEVYREFLYDGLKFKSFASIRELDDRLILIDSISKTFSACGARIGAIISRNNELMKQALKLCQSRLCVATLEMIGATALYNVDQSFLDNCRVEYEERRDLVFARLEKMPGVIVKKPQGAFYMIIKLPVDSAENFVRWMLTDFDLDGDTLMVAPAPGFYSHPDMGTNEARIAYVLNKEDLTKAMNVLEAALKAYPGRTN